MHEADLLKKINELLKTFEHGLGEKGVKAEAYLCWIKEDEKYCTMPDQIDAVVVTVNFICKDMPDHVMDLSLTMAYDDVENVADNIYKQMEGYINQYARYIIKKGYGYALSKYNVNVAKIKPIGKVLKSIFNYRNVIIGLITLSTIILVIDIIRRFVL